MGRDFGRDLRAHWLLEPDALFLNHGSYGATPRAVLAAQASWRAAMERAPDDFMRRRYLPELRAAAGRLGAFLGTSGDSLAFLENATAAVNVVLRAARLGPADEVLISDHAYAAVRQAAEVVCQDHGARLMTAHLPIPVESEESIVTAISSAVSNRTRLVIIDHITSSTAMRMPLARLVPLLRARGVRVLIDGAHAPGQIPLDIPSVGTHWYVGNAHKWLFAPKGCAFLWAGDEVREQTRPLVVSHDYRLSFPHCFDWTGSRDPSAWLSIGAALEFLGSFGAAEVMAHNRALASEAAGILASDLNAVATAPAALRAAMTALILKGPERGVEAARSLQEWLWHEHRISVSVSAPHGPLIMRVSAQLYNETWEYERLAGAIKRWMGS